jgi:hypothetical protein
LIYAPIQDLLTDEQLSVIEVFKRFALLKVRYEGAQSSEPLETWDGQLSCDFTFLDKIVSVDPWEFVRAITDKHQELFLALRDEDYPHSDRLSSIIRGGECLSNYVAECALTKDSLAEKMSQIEIVRRWSLCDCLSIIMTYRSFGSFEIITPHSPSILALRKRRNCTTRR